MRVRVRVCVCECVCVCAYVGVRRMARDKEQEHEMSRWDKAGDLPATCFILYHTPHPPTESQAQCKGEDPVHVREAPGLDDTSSSSSISLAPCLRPDEPAVAAAKSRPLSTTMHRSPKRAIVTQAIVTACVTMSLMRLLSTTRT
jgi:hypothetical protein